MLWDVINSPSITIIGVFLYLFGVMFSIGFHEFSHAKSAQLLGDRTPEMQGRVTLNPLAHLDPVGFFAILFAPFGWGKPVQVDPNQMNGNRPERSYFISSIVGPLSNVFLCVVIFFIAWGFAALSSHNILPLSIVDQRSIFYVLILLFSFNIALALFNLIPVPPLDGSKIWPLVLPYNIRITVEPFLLKYGFVLLLLIAFPIIPMGNSTTSIAGLFMSPLSNWLISHVFSLIG